MLRLLLSSFIFFFNDTATTEIYTLSLHDALPICTWPRTIRCSRSWLVASGRGGSTAQPRQKARSGEASEDRKSTRLNSSHSQISYAVFCLKKKKSRQARMQR